MAESWLCIFLRGVVNKCLEKISQKKGELKLREIVVLPKAPPKEMKVLVVPTLQQMDYARKAEPNVVLSKDELQKLQGQKRAIKKLASQNDWFHFSSYLDKMSSYLPSATSLTTNFGSFPSTVSPIDLAVPKMLLTAAFRVLAVRAGFFMTATLITCSIVMFPIFLCSGSPLGASARNYLIHR